MSNKPQSNKEANIRTYYGEVNKFNQNGEYDKAIKSLNKSKSSLSPSQVDNNSCFSRCINLLNNFQFWM